MSEFPPGVYPSISDPLTYTLRYPWPPIVRTYTEQFVLITCRKEFVTAAGPSLEAAVALLATELATIPGIGAALGGVVELGFHWYAHASLNDDGSLTLEFAYHYCGTKGGGLDITAVGVNADTWKSIVDGLIQGISQLNESPDNIGRLPAVEIHDKTYVAAQEAEKEH